MKEQGTNNLTDKQRAQIAVARARRLKRKDEQPDVRPQPVYRGPDDDRITLDDFENKYYPKVEEPAPIELPSRWFIFKEKAKASFIRIKEGMAQGYTTLSQQFRTSMGNVIQKLGSFFASLQDKYNTWREEKRREERVEAPVKMKGGFYDVPPPEDERHTDSYVCRMLAMHFKDTSTKAHLKIGFQWPRQPDHPKPQKFQEPGRPIERRRFWFEQ